MRYLDLTLPTAAENLALDEALLLKAEAEPGGEVLRFWAWNRPAVVLGSGCRLVEDVNQAACLADQVPILRRTSGGGTVLLDQGCLCYSLILAYDHSPALREISRSYAYILQQVGAALAGIVPNIERAGISDLTSAGRKFSGNSQQRKRRHLLHHGTLLHGFNLAQVGRYLHLPSRRPDYRHNRDHASFLFNLPTDAAALKERLQSAWPTDTRLDSWPEDLVRQLVAEKYQQPEWIQRR